MIALTVALAVLVGVSLGLLGGGGSILLVPLLTYVAGLPAKDAIAVSLVVVAVTSAVAAISHARAGRVQWRTALLFGSAGIVGAYAGGLLSHLVPGTVLLIAFAVVMVAAGLAMLRGRRECPDGQRISVPKALGQGAAVGILTGLLGAGGGFLVVPALALLGGLAMPAAVGTSLVVIAMNCVAGLAGHLSGAALDWRLAGMVTAAAVAGALLGSRLAARIDPDGLRAGFGWFVLLMASLVLAEEVHPALGLTTAGLTVVAATIWLGCRTDVYCPIRTLLHRTSTVAVP